MSVIYVHLYFLWTKTDFGPKKRTFWTKTDHFCALKSEIVRLWTKVRKNGPVGSTGLGMGPTLQFYSQIGLFGLNCATRRSRPTPTAQPIPAPTRRVTVQPAPSLADFQISCPVMPCCGLLDQSKHASKNLLNINNKGDSWNYNLNQKQCQYFG